MTIGLWVTGQLGLYINPDGAWFAVTMAIIALVGCAVSFALPRGAEADHGHDHGDPERGHDDHGGQPGRPNPASADPDRLRPLCRRFRRDPGHQGPPFRLAPIRRPFGARGGLGPAERAPQLVELAAAGGAGGDVGFDPCRLLRREIAAGEEGQGLSGFSADHRRSSR